MEPERPERPESSVLVSQALERAIETLLARRRPGATICPSEAARAVASARDEPWRPLVAPARDAAARLAVQGRVEITQTGEVVDMATAQGPVRIRATSPPQPGD